MNTDLTTAAVERLTAQLGEALFGEPGLSLMEIANRRGEIEEMRRDARRVSWMEESVDRFHNIDRISATSGYFNSVYRSLRQAIDAAMKEQAE